MYNRQFYHNLSEMKKIQSFLLFKKFFPPKNFGKSFFQFSFKNFFLILNFFFNKKNIEKIQIKKIFKNFSKWSNFSKNAKNCVSRFNLQIQFGLK